MVSSVVDRTLDDRLVEEDTGDRIVETAEVEGRRSDGMGFGSGEGHGTKASAGKTSMKVSSNGDTLFIFSLLRLQTELIG
jgi:hypothetical protein